jgi:hypothetical protein
VEELVPLYKAAMRRFNSVGKVTIMGRNDGHAISVFKRLWEQTELTIRFRVAHGFARNAYRPEAITKRVGNLSGFGDAWLKIAAANVGNPDGALGNGRGWTRKRVPRGHRRRTVQYVEEAEGAQHRVETGNMGDSLVREYELLKGEAHALEKDRSHGRTDTVCDGSCE